MKPGDEVRRKRGQQTKGTITGMYRQCGDGHDRARVQWWVPGNDYANQRIYLGCTVIRCSGLVVVEAGT